MRVVILPSSEFPFHSAVAFLSVSNSPSCYSGHKEIRCSLAGVAQLLIHQLRSLVWFLIRARAQVVGSVLGPGVCKRQTSMFLSLPLLYHFK